MNVHAPAAEAAAPTVFMVWLRACCSEATSLSYPGFNRKHMQTVHKVRFLF